jgi:hypothetical protein
MDMPLQDLTVDELGLLEVLQKHGSDGRAIPVLSAIALAPLRADRPPLAAALAGLMQKRVIDPCGIDAITGKPSGYRPTGSVTPASENG